jgi:serine/threonine-protein kinase
LAGANLTGTGMLVGTPEYMSPEQIGGQPVDGRSDLYSLGVVLYQMLTGYVPFGGEDTSAILFAQMNKPPTPPSRLTALVTPAVEAVVLRALSKSPQDRYASAMQLFREFAQAVTGTNAPQSVTPPPTHVAPATPSPVFVPAPTLTAPTALPAASLPSASLGAPSRAYLGLWALVVGVGVLGLVAVIVAVLLATGVLGPGGGLRGIGSVSATDTPTRRVPAATATATAGAVVPAASPTRAPASATPLPPPTRTATRAPPSATVAPTQAVSPTATLTRPAATPTARPPTRPAVTAAPTATPTTDEPRAVTMQAPAAGASFKSSVITFKWTGGALKAGEHFVVQIIPTLSEKKGDCMTEGDYGSSGYQYSPPLTTHEWTKDIMAIAAGMTKPCAGRIEWRVHVMDAAGNVVQSTPRVHFVWNPL